MPTYTVVETCTYTYRVEAESPEDAVELIECGLVDTLTYDLVGYTIEEE